MKLSSQNWSNFAREEINIITHSQYASTKAACYRAMKITSKYFKYNPNPFLLKSLEGYFRNSNSVGFNDSFIKEVTIQCLEYIITHEKDNK